MSVHPPRRLYPYAAAVYAHLLPRLREVAQEHGYALAVHGSMATDFDLVACPWTEEAADAHVMIEALRSSVNAVLSPRDWDANPSQRPHGRLAWAFYFDEKSAREFSGPYLDISVMPRLLQNSEETKPLARETSEGMCPQCGQPLGITGTCYGCELAKNDGTWHCPLCRFTLHKRLLRACDGAIAVNPDAAREVCPNDGATLVPGERSPNDRHALRVGM